MLNQIVSGGLIVGSAAAIQFVVLFATQVLLARFLSPEVFGSFALISTIIMFLHTMGNIQGDRYIIVTQKNSQTNLDNVFTVELLWVILLMGCSFILLPSLLKFLKIPEAVIHAQVFTVILLQNPLMKAKALLEKKFSFAKATLPTLISHIIAGGAAIFMAAQGYGLWSLVWWKVITFTLESIITWSVIPYRPKLSFDFYIFKDSITFSYPIMLSAIIAFFYSNIDYYLINHLIDARAVGFYWLAYQASHYLLSIRASVNRVILPVMSQMDDFDGKMQIFRLMTSLTTIIYFIIIIIIVLFAEEIISLTYGEKWLAVASLLKIFSCVVLFKAVSANSIPLLHSARVTMSDLEISVFNLLLLPPAIYFLTKNYGPIGAACALFIVGNLSIFYIHQKYVRPLINQGYFSYYKKILILFFVLGVTLIGLASMNSIMLYRGTGFLFLLFILFFMFKEEIRDLWMYFKKEVVQ